MAIVVYCKFIDFWYHYNFIEMHTFIYIWDVLIRLNIIKLILEEWVEKTLAYIQSSTPPVFNKILYSQN